MKRAAAVAGITLAVTRPAAAHAIAERYDLPVPLGYFVAGSAAVVAVTFAATALFVLSAPPRRDERRIRSPGALCLVAHSLRGFGVAVFLLVIAAGLFGHEHPARNIAPSTWYVAIGAIVRGHVVAVWLAHVVALRSAPSRTFAIRALLPLTFLETNGRLYGIEPFDPRRAAGKVPRTGSGLLARNLRSRLRRSGSNFTTLSSSTLRAAWLRGATARPLPSAADGRSTGPPGSAASRSGRRPRSRWPRSRKVVGEHLARDFHQYGQNGPGPQ